VAPAETEPEKAAPSEVWGLFLTRLFRETNETPSGHALCVWTPLVTISSAVPARTIQLRVANVAHHPQEPAATTPEPPHSAFETAAAVVPEPQASSVTASAAEALPNGEAAAEEVRRHL